MNCSRTLLIVLCSLFQIAILAQDCPPGLSFEFESQSDLNAFLASYPDCTEIEGNVTVGRLLPPTNQNFSINSLVPLENITKINGDFRIGPNTNLVDMNGLGNLNSIGGDLEIRGGFQTNSLEGLESLESVGNRMTISSTDIANFAEHRT